MPGLINSAMTGLGQDLGQGFESFSPQSETPAPSIKEWYDALGDGKAMAIFDKLVWGMLGDGRLTGDYVKAQMGDDYLSYLKQLFSPQEGSEPDRNVQMFFPESPQLGYGMPNVYRGPLVREGKESLPRARPTPSFDPEPWLKGI